jgi:hypothetical protein
MPAFADRSPGLDLEVTVVEVELGKSKEIAVGKASGEWLCVPEGVLKATIVSKGTSNYWVITPRQLSRTQCRVGSGLDDNDRIFDITVTKPLAKKSKPKPAPKRGKSAVKSSAKTSTSHGPLWEVFSQRGDVKLTE